MASAVIMMQWSSYIGQAGARGFFDVEPLTFNSRQARLHELGKNDVLWLVSRCLEDKQYYFVGVLHILDRRKNPSDSETTSEYGEFCLIADRERSYDLRRGFPAEGFLRALDFDTGKPIKYGASMGQSLQTLRFLSRTDERILGTALKRVLAHAAGPADQPTGLWTKCDAQFADYFAANWQQRREPLAFLLYDPPLLLPQGAPVFIHSDKTLRLVARFCGG